MKIVEIFSPTCIPCKMLKPRLEDLKKEYPNSNLEFQFINIMDYYNIDPELIEKDTSLPQAVRDNIDSIKGTPHIFLLDDEGNTLINKHADFTILQEIKSFLK